MKNQDDDKVAEAVEAERQRCVEIIDMYQGEFDGSPLYQVWCRMRNQVAAGKRVASGDVNGSLPADPAG